MPAGAPATLTAIEALRDLIKGISSGPSYDTDVAHAVIGNEPIPHQTIFPAAIIRPSRTTHDVPGTGGVQTMDTDLVVVVDIFIDQVARSEAEVAAAHEDLLKFTRDVQQAVLDDDTLGGTCRHARPTSADHFVTAWEGRQLHGAELQFLVKLVTDRSNLNQCV